VRATLVFLLASLVTMTGCVDNKKKMQQARKKLGLEARLVFTLGKIETDTKVKTSAMPLPDAGDVCWLGDEKLCELTFGKFVAAP
jgi:hypothetical protein